MAWLAKVEARTQTWPLGAYIAAVAVKWYLVGLGAYALGRVVFDRLGIWSLYGDY